MAARGRLPPWGDAVKRRRLPRYGRTPTGLNPWRVHICRVSGLPDATLARFWRTGARAVRHARTGRTWRHVTTPPDTRSRARSGNWGDL